MISPLHSLGYVSTAWALISSSNELAIVNMAKPMGRWGDGVMGQWKSLQIPVSQYPNAPFSHLFSFVPEMLREIPARAIGQHRHDHTALALGSHLETTHHSGASGNSNRQPFFAR